MAYIKKGVQSRHLLFILGFLKLVLLHTAVGQDITLGLSTTYDQNIFDTYSPLKDLVTEASLTASKGWGFETSYLGCYYGGTLALYRDLTARNYHSHVGVVSWIYHFPPSYQSEEAENSEDTDDDDLTEPDSAEAESEEEDTEAPDSTNQSAEKTGSASVQEQTSASEVAHSDSLDRYLTISAIGGIQSNKAAYEQWNHSSATGIITFRQPLGVNVSIRPSYLPIYHSYPNLSVLTNVQHVFNLHLGTDIIPKSWICITGSFGYKAYITKQTGQDTIYIIKPGHGKGGEMVTDTVLQYDFTTPSLSQPWVSAQWAYKPLDGTEGTLQFTYYMNPTSIARALPTLRGGASIATNFDQNELYDDHFSFNGIEFDVALEQSIPLKLIFKANFRYQHKTYTYSARDLAGTAVAPNRIDDRLQISLALSRSFSLGKAGNIKLTGQYHYLRNSSNAAYFVFGKNKFMIGAEYSF